MQLVRTESSDLSEKILPRAAQIASAIGLIYFTLTVLCAALYYMAGMAPFEAAAHAMSSVATGGFSTQPDSAAAFSAEAQWILVLFMAVAGANFALTVDGAGPITVTRTGDLDPAL